MIDKGDRKMRRIDYRGEEYLIHTRSGMRLIDVLRESGISVTCDCNGIDHSSSACMVKWPKDTLHLLTAPTPFEQKILGDAQLAAGYRLSCQAMFK